MERKRETVKEKHRRGTDGKNEAERESEKKKKKVTRDSTFRMVPVLSSGEVLKCHGGIFW